jgi:hypothetical protein
MIVGYRQVIDVIDQQIDTARPVEILFVFDAVLGSRRSNQEYR